MIFALALFFLSINSVRKIGFSRNLQVDWKGKITGLTLRQVLGGCSFNHNYIIITVQFTVDIGPVRLEFINVTTVCMKYKDKFYRSIVFI